MSEKGAADQQARTAPMIRPAKAALVAKSQLTLLHVSPGTASEWTEFPGVRETLETWT